MAVDVGLTHLHQDSICEICEPSEFHVSRSKDLLETEANRFSKLHLRLVSILAMKRMQNLKEKHTSHRRPQWTAAAALFSKIYFDRCFFVDKTIGCSNWAPHRRAARKQFMSAKIKENIQRKEGQILCKCHVFVTIRRVRIFIFRAIR
jgi:hypothetical protein